MNTVALRAYHGDPAIKAKYIARIREHRAAEHLIQGIGWESNSQGTMGCAVGCTLETYDHARYPIELGIPEWLARLEDSIFEGLPKKDAQAWPEQFLQAIHPGADLESVQHHIALRRIDRLIALQSDNLGKHDDPIDAAIKGVIKALIQVRHCHQTELGGTVCGMSARSAARSAWSAAESAARSAAESAADSAAESTYQQEASDLLELLVACVP